MMAEIKVGDKVRLIRTDQKGKVEHVYADGKAKVRLPTGEIIFESVKYLVKILPYFIQLWTMIKNFISDLKSNK